ncbi:MAG: sensor histidine kinase [Phycisphaerae bacterium]
MSKIFREFKRFWTAEEVPRWFGLSIVLIYLTGLGAVAWFGVQQMRSRASVQFTRSSVYALEVLAERLESEAGAWLAPTASRGPCQRLLAALAANVPVHTLRVVDDRRIAIASLDAGEIGTRLTEPIIGTPHPNGVEVIDVPPSADREACTFVRIPLAVASQGDVSDVGSGGATPRANASASAAGGAAPRGDAAGAPAASAPVSDAVVLEALLPRTAPHAPALAEHAGELSVVLVVLGALFMVYRRLRCALRSAARIVDRLERDVAAIDTDLTALRITDVTDTVAAGWNRLIDVSQTLRQELDRVQANRELAQVFERRDGGALAEALNALPDGMLYIGDEGRIEYVNTACAHLMGCDAAAVKGVAPAEVAASGVGGAVLRVLQGALRSDGTFQPGNELIEAEGDEGTYRVWVIPLQPVERVGACLVVVRDVSQQVRAERTREDFITQVTHELRTPLTNIRAYAETLSSGMFDDPKVITECYNVITKETRRLSRLIEDILNVSQMEVGSIELVLDSVDLGTLLRDGVGDVRGLADEKNIDLQVKLPAKLEPIRADRDKLAVVINNLLGNAIKYTPAGGCVVVTCQIKPNVAAITVKDDGIGIDPSDHDRVFEKFGRSSDPAVQNTTGTGIGLYTAREIVRRHGGDIELFSEKGAGATFVVNLPHREGRSATLSTREEL